MTLVHVVGVVTVRHRLVPAAGAVRVRGVVRTARVLGGTRRGVRAPDRDLALVDVIAVRPVHVSVVQIVGVAVVLHRRVTAPGAVDVRRAASIAVRRATTDAGSSRRAGA